MKKLTYDLIVFVLLCMFAAVAFEHSKYSLTIIPLMLSGYYLARIVDDILLEMDM